MTASKSSATRVASTSAPGKIPIITRRLVPVILLMAEENRAYKLSVSLHGATAEAIFRARCPAGRDFPLVERLSSCMTYGEQTFCALFLMDPHRPAPMTLRPYPSTQLAALLFGLDAHASSSRLIPPLAHRLATSAGTAI